MLATVSLHTATSTHREGESSFAYFNKRNPKIRSLTGEPINYCIYFSTRFFGGLWLVHRALRPAESTLGFFPRRCCDRGIHGCNRTDPGIWSFCATLSARNGSLNNSCGLVGSGCWFGCCRG